RDRSRRPDLPRAGRRGHAGGAGPGGVAVRGRSAGRLDVKDAPPFEEWLLGEREALRDLALSSLARILASQRDGDDPAGALHTALRLLALDPLQEVVHRTVMRLQTAQGRRDAALRQYQTCVDVLQRELGVEPEAETKRLYREVLLQRDTEQSHGNAPAEQPSPGHVEAASDVEVL